MNKEAALKRDLIKLAYANPELREDLLPVIVGKEAGLAKTPEAAKKLFQKYKQKHPGTSKKVEDFLAKGKEVGKKVKEKAKDVADTVKDPEKLKQKGKEVGEKAKEVGKKTKKKVKEETKKVKKQIEDAGGVLDFVKNEFEGNLGEAGKGLTEKLDQASKKMDALKEEGKKVPGKLKNKVKELKNNLKSEVMDKVKNKKASQQSLHKYRRASLMIRVAYLKPEYREKLLPKIKKNLELEQ